MAYLVYDLIIKLADKDYTNNTVIQALITLIITVFLGGYFSKWLEHKNARKIELYRIRTDISLKVIDYASILFHHPERDHAKIIDNLLRWNGVSSTQKSEAKNGRNQETVRRGL